MSKKSKVVDGEIVEPDTAIAIVEPNAIATVGQVANQHAAQNAVSKYLSGKAQNTIRRQAAGLNLFATYLNAIGDTLGDCMTDFANDVATWVMSSEADFNPAIPDVNCWQGITWGLIEGFQNWQLQRGYAIGTVNVRLSTIKKYAALAGKADVIPSDEIGKIKLITGFSRREGKNLDDIRHTTRFHPKPGAPVQTIKKAAAVEIAPSDAKALKYQHDDTPQGFRDSLLMCILLDHGLRCGEAAILTVGNFDIKTGYFTFYRPKVDKTQTHKMTDDTLKAARAYLELIDTDEPAAPLLRGSTKSGKLRATGMSERAITKRVKVLGASLDIDGLSAHDCRHYWATNAARNGTALDRLMDAGGWNSYAMPLRYVQAASVANEGVKGFNTND